MNDQSREQLRTTFDQAAELYDRARPGYPAELIAELAGLAGIQPGSRVLEVGCGTGQLTVPLAERGCEIVALDIGPNLAARARQNLALYPSACVIVVAFEDWPLPTQPFDAVVSATAFHWLDPAVRVHKAADALRPGGALATIATHHIAGGDEEFFVEAQGCYAQWDPSTPPGGVCLPAPSDIPLESQEIDRSGRFGPVTFRRYEWEQTYTTATYCELLLTYSGHRALAPESLRGLLDCIAHRIDSRYHGKIRKRYLSELRLAYHLPANPPR
jgi:SAM-dependent methyltransferase